MKLKNKPNQGLWLLAAGLIVLATLAGGYAYLRKAKADMTLKGKAEMDALHGEVYRLRQNISQQDAKLNYLLNPNLERILAKGNDDTFCWLYYRSIDSTWYAEVSGAKELEEVFQYRLYTLSNQRDTSYVGFFERIADTVGLQKVGVAPKENGLYITGAHRDSPANLAEESLLYSAEN